MPSQFVINLGSASIAGECVGQGSAIVFLHAGVADQRMWESQLAHFKDSHTAIAYDRRGFGKTTAIDQEFRHLDDLAKVLDYHGIEKAVICGCSAGARIAIDFALTHAARTTALVLVSATYTGADWSEITEPEIELAKALDQAEGEYDLDLVNRLEAHAWLDGPASEAGRAKPALQELFLNMNGIALAAPELTQETEPKSAKSQLSQIQCPTLLIEGDLDFEMIHRHHQTLDSEIQHSVRIKMDDAAHLPSMELPDQFNKHLRDFITF